VNNNSCNYDQTTTISTYYELASCNCAPQYDGRLIKYKILKIIVLIFIGIFCEEPYDGCALTSACRIYWDNNTVCIPLNATEQVLQNRSYTCHGECEYGFTSTDNYTCEGKRSSYFKKSN